MPAGQWLLIAAGGALGAVTRVALTAWIAHRWPSAFPWGTFWVNISAAFLLGTVLAVLTQRTDLAAHSRLLLASGFIASYSTFSTLTYDSLMLLQSGQAWRAGLNLVASLAAGLLAVWLGTLLGRQL